MLPLVVENTMGKLCTTINKLTSNVQSVYIYGSVALGDYVEGSSDIDFIGILRKPPSKADIQAISAAHAEVEAEIPDTDIMGSYMLEQDLGKSANHINPLLAYYNKQLNEEGRGVDINPITWWILKKHGIRIYGSKVSFNYQLEGKLLASYVIQNLNTYWVGWIERLEKTSNLSDQELDEAVEWCTLGMLRQLYTIRENNIKSKTEAGLYGITVIPKHWHALIYEAINIKQLRPGRHYSSKEKRLADLVQLLRFIHSEANHTFDNQN
jgi:hypothetical protein